MEITKNVILDLLPLYLADEVSADTRALIEEYLETDPELAEIAKQSGAMELPGDIPIPLTQEDKMKAYNKSKTIMIVTIVLLAALMATILGIIMLAFFTSA
jgi:hypothetical protein